MTVEEALSCPAPGQLALLLEHRWLSYEQLLDGTAFLFSSQAEAQVFAGRLAEARRMVLEPGTRHVGGGWYRAPVVHWTPAWDEARLLAAAPGREVFQRLSCLPVQWVRFNGGQAVVGEFPRAALLGRDLRPGAEILRARSVAEIHMFLAFEGVSEPEHSLVYLGSELVARYQDSRHEYFFYPVDSVVEVGEGRTEILCAGMLANQVRARAEKPSAYPPEMVAEFRMWADELLKLVDPATDAIPRTCLRYSYADWLLEHKCPTLLDGAQLRAWRKALE